MLRDDGAALEAVDRLIHEGSPLSMSAKGSVIIVAPGVP
jgi:hypothetical protein